MPIAQKKQFLLFFRKVIEPIRGFYPMHLASYRPVHLEMLKMMIEVERETGMLSNTKKAYNLTDRMGLSPVFREEE